MPQLTIAGRPPRARRTDPVSAMLRSGALVTGMIALVAATITAVVRGGPGAVSAMLGAVVVLAFFSSGVTCVAALLRRTISFSMVGALGIYALQAFGLLVLAEILSSTDLLDRAGFVAGATTAVFSWQAGASFGWLHARHQVYAVALPGEEDHG